MRDGRYAPFDQRSGTQVAHGDSRGCTQQVTGAPLVAANVPVNSCNGGNAGGNGGCTQQVSQSTLVAANAPIGSCNSTPVAHPITEAAAGLR